MLKTVENLGKLRNLAQAQKQETLVPVLFYRSVPVLLQHFRMDCLQSEKTFTCICFLI